MRPQDQFDRILSICKLFSPIVFNSQGNLPHSGPIPTCSDIEIIALSIFQSLLSIESGAVSFLCFVSCYPDFRCDFLDVTLTHAVADWRNSLKSWENGFLSFSVTTLAIVCWLLTLCLLKHAGIPEQLAAVFSGLCSLVWLLCGSTTIVLGIQVPLCVYCRRGHCALWFESGAPPRH